MIYYIADTHFNDQRIMDLCKRPFKSLEEMNKTIIDNWNNRVKDDDTVYVLGDIANNEDPKSIKIFRELKGHKHLILGNHDQPLIASIRESNIFESIEYMKAIMDNKEFVFLCHYPLMDWPGFNVRFNEKFDTRSSLIYGHIHNKTIKEGTEYAQIKAYYSDKKAYNAGVDVIGFTPRTLEELKTLKEANKNEPYIN